MPTDTNSEPGMQLKYRNDLQTSKVLRTNSDHLQFFLCAIYIFIQQKKNEISTTAALVFLMSAAYLC